MLDPVADDGDFARGNMGDRTRGLSRSRLSLDSIEGVLTRQVGSGGGFPCEKVRPHSPAVTRKNRLPPANFVGASTSVSAPVAGRSQSDPLLTKPVEVSMP